MTIVTKLSIINMTTYLANSSVLNLKITSGKKVIYLSNSFQSVKMTIVTKLPSEAEKKKEAEANETPLVQVFKTHLVVIVVIILLVTKSSLSSLY